MFFQENAMHLCLSGQHDAHWVRADVSPGYRCHGPRFEVWEHCLSVRHDQKKRKTFTAVVDVVLVGVRKEESRAARIEVMAVSGKPAAVAPAKQLPALPQLLRSSRLSTAPSGLPSAVLGTDPDHAAAWDCQ